jgi:hypothetical protein
MLAFFQTVVSDPGTIDLVSTGGQLTLMSAFIWVTNRVVGPIVKAAEAFTKNLEDASDHRFEEEKHWRVCEAHQEREEQLLAQIAGHFMLEADGARH